MFLAGFIAAILGLVGCVTAMLLLEAMLDSSIDLWGRRRVVQASVIAIVGAGLAGLITFATQPSQPDTGRGMGFAFGLFAAVVALAFYTNMKRSRRKTSRQDV